jgi:iron(III) transport system substrate-binding protein
MTGWVRRITCEWFSFAVTPSHSLEVPMIRRTLLGLVPALMIAAPALAQGQRGEVAVYSARHYDSDKRLYEAFTRDTGIRVRLIEGDADQLMDRIRNEGANSPADVLITVDAARLARAKEAGITQPVQSQAVTSRVPEGLRDPEGHWFAVSKRARVIMYDKQAGVPQGLARYEDLADPRFRGPDLRPRREPSPTTPASPPRSSRPTGRSGRGWAEGCRAQPGPPAAGRRPRPVPRHP